MKKSVLSAILLILYVMTFSACQNQTVSMKVTLDGKSVAPCNKAEIRKLSPENGGYRFNCPLKGTSVYVIYDTINPPFKGNVKNIWFVTWDPQPGEKKIPTVYAWYYKLINGARRSLKKNTSGRIEQFKKNIFGRIKHGSYEFNLSGPNKKIIFTLGSPGK